MKKIILLVAVVAMFSGCVSTQEKLDKYIEVRNKAITTVGVVKCEKDCFSDCNAISNTIDRVDCKSLCVDKCYGI